MKGIDSSQSPLNPEQKKAVEFGTGPLLIIAGAGTGKTTVITERIKYLISVGKAKPDEILALTFTEKASREMEERIDMSFPYGLTNMWISTFHAFCDRVLRADGISIGLNPAYSLLSEAESIQFFRSHLFDFDLKYYRPLGNPTKFIEGILQHFSRLKDEDVSPDEYTRWVHKKSNVKSTMKITEEEKEDMEKYSELARAYKAYEELKAKEGVMDYGDLIEKTLTLFRLRPNVLARYHTQFKYVLIDEFQDTNFAQNELAVLLAGKKKNITVVGDDDQAIYRWRGAAVSNIIQFRKRFPRSRAVVLTKNYRSVKEILDRSYDLIQKNNPDRLEVLEKIDKKLICTRRLSGVPVECIIQNRVEEEADAVAQSILDCLKSDSTKTFKDVAILVRANAHAEPFVRALSRHGIPYQFLGPGQLLRQGEVKDLIAYLKVLYDITDSVALYRVLSIEEFHIDPTDIASIVSFARRDGISFFEACEEAVNHRENMSPGISDETHQKVKKIIDLIKKHLGMMRKETAGQILYYFVEQSGLLSSYVSGKTERNEIAAQNVAAFFDRLKTYEANHVNSDVFSVVEYVNLSLDLGESPKASNTDWSEQNAVNILTIHSAKGLEFSIVFLVNLVSARFPTIEKREQIPIPDDLIKEVLPQGDAHIEEERRLFYVGMTRAKDRLFLTAAKYYGEGKREKKISPFVSEALGEEYVSHQLRKTIETHAVHQLSILDWAKPEERTYTKVARPVHYLSYSQIETFDTCPLQYKYRYVIRLPTPPSAALVFGDTIHRTLRNFYEDVKSGNSMTEEILLRLYDAAWKNSGFQNRKFEEKMKERGVALLSDFFRRAFDPNVRVLDLEKAFKVKITPSLSVGGKIDRVDTLRDGTIEIIDYKTGKSPEKRSPETDRQLTVYALAACDKSMYGSDPSSVTVSLYFLESLSKASAKKTNEQLNEMRRFIEESARNISTSDFSPTPGKQCDFCEFRLICDAWK